MDWLDYREKLGIGFCDAEKVSLFMVKAFNLLDGMNHDYMYEQITGTEYFDFCDTTGTPMKHGDIYYSGYNLIIEILHKHTSSLEEFLAYYLAFVNCQKDSSNKKWTKEKFKNVICAMLNDSHLPFDIYEDEDGYFIFPKGAKELDDALVSEPLEWLKGYPQAHKTYCIALKQYADGIYIRDVADNLRKALEAFLQEFLGNTQNLESNKNNICRYLGEQGVDAGVSGLFQPLINAYKNINDRIAKHNDAVDEKLLEFLLYQTGVLIRMVLVTSNKEDTK